MKKDDLVVISLRNHIIDAVGVITGDYEYDSKNQYGFHHLRKVKWLGKNMNATPDLFLDKAISQMTICELNKQDVKVEKFEQYFESKEDSDSQQDYVLIIDEINRGNIAAIFGELITLLEEDKRLGSKEQIELVLPYSKETFTIPKNLYIIGTMNTADRSVEALDSALRRRFSFIEICPNTKTVEICHPTQGLLEEDNIDLIPLLDTLNCRIELLKDKDHKIGHSFFIQVTSLEKLKGVFSNKVIPSLEECFFNDLNKIGLILGKDFIHPVEYNSKTNFADFDDEDQSLYTEKKIMNSQILINGKLNLLLVFMKIPIND